MFRRSVFLAVCMAAVFLFVAASESNASPARVAGLNLSGPATGFVRDYVNTYPYPVAMNRYPNMMWANLGSRNPYGGFQATQRAMGMFHELGDDGTYGILGVTLREDSPMDPVLQSMDLLGASHQQFDLTYGRDMEQVSLGIRFDMAHSSREDEAGNISKPYETHIGPADSAAYVNTWGLGVAVDIDINEDAMLEVGGEVRFYTFEDEVNGFSDDGSISMRLNGRVFWERSENKTMIPLVSFSRTQVGQENGVALVETMDDFYAGVACNQVVNSDDLLIYGAAFRMVSRETSNDVVELDRTDSSAPVLFMAVEHRFRDWLVGRGGASQAMAWRSYGPDDLHFADQKQLDSDFDFALGIAMEFSNFTIDATLNQNYPFTGFWFVSGQSTSDLFGMVSFTYTY